MVIRVINAEVTHLYFRHQRLHFMEEFSSRRMRDGLIIQILFQSHEKTIELARVDDRPWDDIDMSSVEASYKIRVLFFAYDL
jgi:predicted glycosyltransferase involved in capsule biosynthesis